MRKRLSIIIFLFLIKNLIQEPLEEYELCIYVKNMNFTINGNQYVTTTPDYYSFTVNPGNINFIGRSRDVEQLFSGYLKKGDCIISTNNNIYFTFERQIEGTGIEFEGVTYKSFKNRDFDYRLRVYLFIPSQVPSSCNNDISLSYITYSVKVYLNSENYEISLYDLNAIKNYLPNNQVTIKFGSLEGTMIIDDIEIDQNTPITFSYNSIISYTRAANKLEGYEEKVTFYISNSDGDALSNLSILTISVCGVGCNCGMIYNKCDNCLNDYYFIIAKGNNCTLESEFLNDYPDNIGFYKDSANKIYKKCGEMCRSCEQGYVSPTVNHCKSCNENDNYKYYVIKGNELNCYNEKCNLINSNYRQVENTFECLENLCNDIYKYEYNSEKCFSICPVGTIVIDYPSKKECVVQCEGDYKYHDLSSNKCYNTPCYYNNVYEIENDNLKCVKSCKDDESKYHFIDHQTKIARCLTNCIEPKKFHDNDNEICVSQCPYNKKYYLQDYVCLESCPINYFVQFETNECLVNCGDNYKISSIKTCFTECPNGYPLYLSTTKECVKDCSIELPFKYNDHCINDCKNTEKKFIGFRNECIIDCSSVGLIYYDPDDLRCYLKCPNEKPYGIQPDKICSTECTKESPFIDKEYKICYDDCKNNILKPFTYGGECISECPYLYISLNGLCIPDLKLSYINETFDYSKMSTKEMLNSLSYLIDFYKDVKKNIINDEFILQVFKIDDNDLKDDEYISKIKNIKKLENEIKKHYNIIGDLIFAKIELIKQNSIINHVEFKVYDKEGNEVNLNFLKEEVLYSYQINYIIYTIKLNYYFINNKY